MIAWTVLAAAGRAGDATQVPPHPSAKPPSYLAEIVPLLTRLGCNQGACHGKNAGQNGFRLSLRGYAPEQDLLSITREHQGRRISRTAPADSLLLRKALGEASHKGGTLIRRDSREYRTLLAWIEGQTPDADSSEPALTGLEIRPGERTVRPGERIELTVLAEYADGTKTDVTWLVRFDSNDAGTIAVDKRDFATVMRPGETALRASYRDQVAVVTYTAPHDANPLAERFAERRNFIDEHVFDKLAALRIPPSGPATDEEFLRRVMLDLTGTLPTADEVRWFVADTAADKRTALVDRLFERSEFVDFWTLQLADLLQNRRERDGDVRGAKGVRAMHGWIREQVAANRPWDEFVRDVLTAEGSSVDRPAVGYFIVNMFGQRNGNEAELVSSAAQAFLGTRIGCAKCHNHPLERYTQDDYYHWAAFFSRIKLERKDSKEGATQLIAAHPDEEENTKPVGVVQPRTGKFLAPRALDRRPIKVAPGEDPRAKLAAWMTDPANEAFSGAIVNRVWRHFMGVGLVEPVDDLRASNPPTNVPLWKALTGDFVEGGYDLRRLMKHILTSRAYQLSSATAPGNETETRFYSRYYVRRLPAEVLLDAVCQVCEAPQQFDGYPLGVRAIQVPDPSVKTYFLSVFGRSDRVTACACERSGEVTLPQLLHLQNGDDVLAKIRASEGRAARLVKVHAENEPVIDELSLAALGRKPTDDELAAIAASAGSSDDREELIHDLLWALLNSKEFAFNH